MRSCVACCSRRHHRSEAIAMRMTLLAVFAAVITVSGLAFAAVSAQASTAARPTATCTRRRADRVYDGEGCCAAVPPSSHRPSSSPRRIARSARWARPSSRSTRSSTNSRLRPCPPPSTPPRATRGEELAAAGYLSGTAYTHPALLRLHRPATGTTSASSCSTSPSRRIAPAPSIAPTGYLDAFAQRDLHEDDLHRGRVRHRSAQARLRAAEAAAR